ncbi:hypothetical protein AVEN_167533-1 [Araneus ventricosus]|uniref:Uncharacterized protein n=1 Tax=Araneus ventricosus TaxID=182803 RepID=A0A4Y2NW81_ARAVE|nr:hypothetical protein AVEN_167533-1 [Araneus ventricosus]
MIPNRKHVWGDTGYHPRHAEKVQAETHKEAQARPWASRDVQQAFSVKTWSKMERCHRFDENVDATGENSRCSLVHRDKGLNSGWAGFRTLTTEPNPTGGTRIDPKVRYQSATKFSDTVWKGTIVPTSYSGLFVGNLSLVAFSSIFFHRGGLVVRSRLWGRRVPDSNPIPLKIRRVWGLLHIKSYEVAKRPPAGEAWKPGEGVPDQVSSSTSDRGSKLRGPSLNSPRVASKRDVNITKLNHPHSFNTYEITGENGGGGELFFCLLL